MRALADALIDPAAYAAHLPARVVAALPADAVAFTVTDDASDTAAFSAHYGFALDDCANTIVIRYRAGGVEKYAAVVCLGSRRLDVNGALKAALGAQRLSFAKREDAVALSGMAFGAITLFGLPADWRVLVDEAVVSRERVVMGAGVREAKLLLPARTLAALPGVQIAALSAASAPDT
ncbi:YbaK/EbsC family protein [Chitinasiproducens palmae]|uniref:Cys-tRNA(Pro) deacylase, prolyl-tRNA editing enzyme YbaK/EbsC n=1 Tax=Chitinasiproducens palmae TaxID=1770053 RepID=A0A1H2PLZ2_9BURK|nr:YbaK/EbsC family protein [Chitinasiproducens palmae]SDV46693.1 Cys-tRNA(Pro) deacylase, prolyl-tRNA editing enzyme YbaK/EbsC [Chitinasiproducens palmae]